MSPALLVAVLLAAPVPERLPAEVDDAYALRFNPAGLGRVPGGELRLLAGQERPLDGVVDSDYSLAGYAAIPVFGSATFGLGFEADAVDGDFERLLVAGLGFGRKAMSFGFSYSTVWPLIGDDEGFWSLGAQARPTNWLALGFTARDIGQKVMDRQYDTGLALRPFSRLTLSARWRYEENEKLNEDTLDLAFRAEVEPLSGIVVGGVVDLEERFLLQLSLNLENLTVGGQTDIADGDVGFSTELVFRSYRKPGILPVRRVAVVELAGELKPPATFSLLEGGVRVTPYGGVPIFLERALKDDEVVGVFARIGSLDVGWATLQEVRGAMQRLRDSGRRVDCQLSGSDDKAYYLASVCSKIVVPPPLILGVNGVQAKLLFVGEALDRYGIEAEVYRRDEYKTSPDTYTRSGLSVAQREALGTYVDQIQATLVGGIAKGRGLSNEDVQQILARGVVTSTEALALKMVDEVLYPDQVEDWLRDQYSGRIRIAAGERALQPRRPRYRDAPAIAIINVDAAITSGESSNLPFGLGRSVGAKSLVQALDRAGRSRSIRAVVLRVDSPGGGAVSSDFVARAVRRLAERKPVIASFGDVAASGGYYAASGARVIYAEPTTLTGSIGVFSLRFSAEAMLRRWGINGERLGPGIGTPVPYLNSTDAERALAQKGVDGAYDQFLRVVAEGRKKSVAEIKAVAGGRIWTGTDAKAKGLVDEIGGLVDAIKRARLEAGLGDGEIRVISMPDDVQSLSFGARLAQAAGLRDAPTDVESLWPAGVKDLIGPLLAVDPTRVGAPAPLAWLPYGLSVD